VALGAVLTPRRQLAVARDQVAEWRRVEPPPPASLIILAVVAVLIVGGLWVVNARIDARKAEQCIESGRHNCDTPTR
jgi:hypothetical protein